FATVKVFLSQLYVVDFFLSSRRRHTRSKRDWSSDVCSSDLARWPWAFDNRSRAALRRGFQAVQSCLLDPECPRPFRAAAQSRARSEERRVGKVRSQRYVQWKYTQKLAS